MAQAPRVAPFDVLIIGGGPAGLSAALVLGRARRTVALLDDDRPRNRPARVSHGFFTRDGETPDTLRRLAREQLAPYPVTLVDGTAVRVRAVRAGFEVRTGDGRRLTGRRLLLATGLEDPLPEVEGAETFYGRGVYHCPYCDGWENRDRKLACYGRGKSAALEALGLRQWSADVVLLSDGPSRAPPALLASLDAAGVRLEPRRIARLEGTKGRQGQLTHVVFTDGERRACDALFWVTRPRQRSRLHEQLGLLLTHKTTVKTGKLQRTNVEGVFVAGDAARDVQQISVAAAEGAKAAIAINRSLRKEEFGGD